MITIRIERALGARRMAGRRNKAHSIAVDERRTAGRALARHGVALAVMNDDLALSHGFPHAPAAGETGGRDPNSETSRAETGTGYAESVLRN